MDAWQQFINSQKFENPMSPIVEALGFHFDTMLGDTSRKDSLRALVYIPPVEYNLDGDDYRVLIYNDLTWNTIYDRIPNGNRKFTTLEAFKTEFLSGQFSKHFREEKISRLLE